MPMFFDKLGPEDAQRVDRLAKLAFELRENRAGLLRQYGAENESDLLRKIRSGEVPEHPAYEHYLSARILAEARESLRSELAGLLKELNQ